MIYFYFILVLMILYIYNFKKSKKIISTVLLSFITILVTYLCNMKELSYRESLVGINTAIFVVISFLIFFITLIQLRKCKNISKKIIFIIMGICAYWMYSQHVYTFNNERWINT